MHAAALARGGEPRALSARDRARLAVPLHLRRRPDDYQPANITFDLLPQLDEATRQQLRRDKKARHAEVCQPRAGGVGRVPGTRMPEPGRTPDRALSGRTGARRALRRTTLDGV